MSDSATDAVTGTGTFAPLRQPVFRSIWGTSLFSNFGQLILGVGAAWEMTRLTSDAGMVALVQTAMMLPLMLVALPAGAIADMFDHRRIAMAGLGIAVLFSAAMASLSAAGMMTPMLILTFCALIGAGVALFVPAWQASIREQVPPEQLPAAVALGSISYNAARSVGPAIGGAIVAAVGAQAAFAVNAVSYVPILIAFLLWNRVQTPSRLPPERLDRAIQSGVRYALHSPSIRAILIRVLAFGLASASYAALAALIARDLLGGDARILGLMLGASGIGAVAGATLSAPLTDRLGPENSVRLFIVTAVLALVLIGYSRSLALTCLGFFLAGGANILTIGQFNVAVQLSAPRWVTARALSLFSSAMTGGIAFGAILWGQVASARGVDMAMYGSAVLLAVTLALGWFMPLPRTSFDGVEAVEIGQEPDVALDLTLRSGPVVIEIDYRVDPDNARNFYDAMLAVQRVRLRNGGFNWTLSRDIADPAHWTERYQCPTWGDYLRVRDRFTQADRDAQAMVDSFLIEGTVKRITRLLERPFGSVRWRADSPDPQRDDIGFMVP